MESDIVVARAAEDQEVVARKVARFDLLAIPVVDDDQRMVGIITHDDVIDVFREEAAEDAHRIGAVGPLEHSYLQTHLVTLSWKRGLWLAILFATGSLTALAMRHYQFIQEQWVWLGWFVPLIISSGGNSGSQSATLVITAMATGDIGPKDWLRVVGRELAVGLMLGAFLGLIGFIAAALLLANIWQAAILPITLLLVVTCGTLSGSALPLLFRRLGLDPALMSTPFVAAIIDVVGIVIYMNMAIGAHHMFEDLGQDLDPSDVESRVTDVELQDLTLHLDGANQDPDLVGRELAGVRLGQPFQLVGHRRVLVGRRLQSQPHLLPRSRQGDIVPQVVDIVRPVAQQQAETSHVACVGSRLKILNAFC